MEIVPKYPNLLNVQFHLNLYLYLYPPYQYLLLQYPNINLPIPDRYYQNLFSDYRNRTRTYSNQTPKPLPSGLPLGTSITVEPVLGRKNCAPGTKQFYEVEQR